METRVLTTADVEAFYRLRLEGLQHNPFAFGASAEEFAQQPLESVAQRLSPQGDNFTLGAFVDEALVGVMGLVRGDRIKTRHKGLIWGVYVTPAARGKGIAKALLTDLIERAKAMDGLEQINLTVAVSQTAARRLYQSAGFEVQGYEKRALKVGDTYVDNEQMVLWLR